MDDFADENLITTLLQAQRNGDSDAEHELFRVVYDQLRKVAHNLLIHERDPHTLNSTALVNEVYIKVKKSDLMKKADNRRFFFAALSRAMKQILIDHARRRKRQPDAKNLVLDMILQTAEKENRCDFERLATSLGEFENRYKTEHDMLVYRFFGGMKIKQLAEHFNVSASKVEKDLFFARSWLKAHLNK